jgi:hypothetical protein
MGASTRRRRSYPRHLAARAHASRSARAIPRRRRITTRRVDPGLIEGIGVGWLFGSASMLTFSVLTLIAWRAAASGDRTVTRAIGPIGVLCIVFGAAALVRSGMEPHFIGFVVIGLLAGFAAYAVSRAA